MKDKFISAFMDVAKRFAQLSTAKRLQVGAIIVKEDRIISIGYNGMPAGWDNNCEDKEYMSIDAGGWINPDEIEMMYPYEENGRRYKLKTKDEVIHAEANAIAKLAKSSESGQDSIMFLTHAPCIHCAKQIYTAGIKTVYYEVPYRSTDGIDFLQKCNVNVWRYFPK
jgi:dCMP deaminase